jgi:hypothetical protein
MAAYRITWIDRETRNAALLGLNEEIVTQADVKADSEDHAKTQGIDLDRYECVVETIRSTDEERAKFLRAIEERQWGDAAEMVREFAYDTGFREGGCDTLADWLQMGDWDRPPLGPDEVAEEWDSNQ